MEQVFVMGFRAEGGQIAIEAKSGWTIYISEKVSDYSWIMKPI